MAVMSIGKTDPPVQRLTVDDLARTPDDGRRYELVDGRLDVSPAPVFLHTLIEGRLVHHLGNLAHTGYHVLPGIGINFNADRTHHRIPDLAVIRPHEGEHPYITRPPALAVEVVSPESVLRDSISKRREYAEFGIESYWIINPAPDKISLVELRLKDGQYIETNQVHGKDLFETEFPFPIKLVPHWLADESDEDWRTRIGGD